MCQLRDANPRPLQRFGDEMRRCLPFKGRVHRQHHFFNAGLPGGLLDAGLPGGSLNAGAPGQAGLQLADPQLLGADTVQRRQQAAQHLIAPRKKAAALQRPEIGDIGNHTKEGRIALRIAADATGGFNVEIAAASAFDEAVGDARHRVGQGAHQRLPVLHQIKQDAPRRTRPEARKPRQKRRQILQTVFVHTATLPFCNPSKPSIGLAMRLAFMGTPDFAVTALDALVEAGHDVAAVYTQPPRRANRGRLTKSPVQQRAEALGLAVRTPETLRDPGVQQAFAALRLDVAVVAAYGLLLPQPILDVPRFGCLNIHASLLPRWRGAAPIQRAILAGDEQTGVTIMAMERGLDTGPMLATAAIPIGDQTAGELTAALAGLGAGLLLDVLQRPAPWPMVPQPEGASYAAKIDKAESRIDWARPAAELERLVRAMQPAPGAWFLADGERVKLIEAETVAIDTDAPPGTLLAGETVATTAGGLRLVAVQPAGGRPMAADAYLRGRRLVAGQPL